MKPTITIGAETISSLSGAYGAIERIVCSEMKVRSLKNLSYAEKHAALMRMVDLGMFSLRNSAQYCCKSLDVSKNWLYEHLKQ